MRLFWEMSARAHAMRTHASKLQHAPHKLRRTCVANIPLQRNGCLVLGDPQNGGFHVGFPLTPPKRGTNSKKGTY